MNIEPRAYQDECAERVYRLVCDGAKKKTILVPTGSGKTMIASLIVEKICSTDQRAFLVADNKEIVESCSGMLRELGNNHIKCITLERLLAEKQNADLYILYSLRPTGRNKMAEYLSDDNSTIVVSLGEPRFEALESRGGYEVKTDNVDYAIEVGAPSNLLARLMLYYKKMGNIPPLVYATDSIIDIRDIMDASLQEKNSLCEKLKQDRNRLVHEINLISMETVSTNDSVLLEMNAKLKRKCQYYEQILAGCGISKPTLDEEFEKIELLREKLKDKFHNSDGTINETIISQFETTVAESVVRITKHILTLENRDRYEDKLMELIPEDIWKNKLSDESRLFLITAMMNYESMILMDNWEELDYSGVCLLVTKAFDVEISRRLYTSYIEYLDRKYGRSENIINWPNSMLNRERSGVLEAKDFTLGSVKFVIGVDEKGCIRNNYVHRQFNQYARDVLYKRSLTDSDCEIKTRDMVIYVEKVRNDYRNPSAHRKAIDYVTAEACMDYMLVTSKIIEKILENMKW